MLDKTKLKLRRNTKFIKMGRKENSSIERFIDSLPIPFQIAFYNVYWKIDDIKFYWKINEQLKRIIIILLFLFIIFIVYIIVKYVTKYYI